MNKSTKWIIMGMFLVGATVAQSATLKKVRMNLGHDGQNRLNIRVVELAGAAPVEIGELSVDYPPDSKIFRSLSGNILAPGVKYDIDARLDLPALWAETLRKEAAAFGLRASGGESEGGAWKVGGAIQEWYLENKQVPFGGPIIFFGYAALDLKVQSPMGETTTYPMVLHSFHLDYSGGFSRKDEAEKALAHFMVEGSHEILARLNLDFFKAPIHPKQAKLLERLPADCILNQRNSVYRIGLSGQQEAVPALLALLAREKESHEDCRVVILNALACINTPEARAFMSEQIRRTRMRTAAAWRGGLGSREKRY